MRKTIVCGILLFVSLLVGTARGQSLDEQLFTAVKAGDKTTAEELIAKGADVNARNADSLTPLDFASDSAVAELLIAKGADVNAKAKGDWTPLDSAAAGGRKDIAELLIAKGADLSAKDQNGQTPLYWAYSQKHKEMVELLIEKGADVNAEDDLGDTLLWDAALRKNKEMAELLIAKGANVNARRGTTGPLDQAVMGKDKEMVELLIEKGVDVNSKNSALSWAAYEGDMDLAELLIAKGAEVNAKDKDRDTPLNSAVNQGHIDMVELLIAKGADPNAKNIFDRTPLDLADRNPLAKNKQEIRAILQAAVAESIARQAGNDITKLLAEYKGHIDDNTLRISILNLALKQHSPIPAEAEAAAGRAAYIFKNASSIDDKLNAAKEYLTAIELAPWVANYYFNLCTVLEKTPYTEQALHACRLYLVAAPNAADAAEMQQRIAGLQYASDRDKTQMKQRTTYIKSRDIDDLYRFGGITGTVSGREIAMKLFVDWTAAPPKYQGYVGCLQGDAVLGRPHDLVSTDTWYGFCAPRINMHLVIQPEGEGFVALSSGNDSLRATLDDLFKAKQQTMALAVMFSASGDHGDRFYIVYEQGGLDEKHAGFLMYESDCNGSVLKKDPRALPDDFVSGEVSKGGGFGRFAPEVNPFTLSGSKTDLCTTQFISKTGYHFGESE